MILLEECQQCVMVVTAMALFPFSFIYNSIPLKALVFSFLKVFMMIDHIASIQLFLHNPTFPFDGFVIGNPSMLFCRYS